MLCSVNGGNALAVLGIADDYFVTPDIVVVKGVHRLSRFKHNVVGNINYVINRSHTRGGNSLFHPVGGFLYAQIFNHPADISGAEVEVANLDAYIIRYIPADGFIFGLGRRKFCA